MIPIWLPAAFAAGLFQAWRTAVQQKLRAQLTVSGAGLVRYAYGFPFAILLAVAWFGLNGTSVPVFPGGFLLFCCAAGIAQIFGTACLIKAFGERGFIVGTAFSKTEALQAAFVAALVLHERLNIVVWGGMVLGVAGVLTLAIGGRKLARRDLLAAIGQPAALLGLGSGALFALTGVLVRRATQELDTTDVVAAALTSLVVVMVMQTVMHGLYIAIREPQTWPAVIRTWRTSGLVGLLAALGSACWFTGFAAAPVALVRIIGQVEVIFTFLFARFYLREATRPHEVGGLLLVAVGVVVALAGSLS